MRQSLSLQIVAAKVAVPVHLASAIPAEFTFEAGDAVAFETRGELKGTVKDLDVNAGVTVAVQIASGNPIEQVLDDVVAGLLGTVKTMSPGAPRRWS